GSHHPDGALSPDPSLRLGERGRLDLERDLFALTDFLGRTPPVFYGGQISDNGQLQWLIMANLPGKPESPMFRQIQFSLRCLGGWTRPCSAGVSRSSVRRLAAIEGERFAHFARHSSVGLPRLPYHPVLRHHVDHLDYMLYETRTLRQLVAKRDATIHRLKTKIAVLKETISTQVEQLQILEGEGEGKTSKGMATPTTCTCWWTSARALNAGQLMTWADFKLKFSKYHVPPGLIKKMRDEFRELKQGRLTVVEYRDKFLTLSRYAPDEADTTEKRKERF
ncbi:hypothetical protein QYE76_059469, partial [Lolium multiflorum]